MIEAINRLNDKQREAALHTDGALLVLAGAGSGKTSTMTVRIAHLVEDLGVSPENILAVTFTNKAATEMRERLAKLVGERVRDMWILTFHACCLRILKEHAEKLGYSRYFVIYDPSDQKVIIKKAMEEFGLDSNQYKPIFVQSIISKSKERGESVQDFERRNNDSIINRKLAKIYKFYQDSLKKNNAMDFDDLLYNAAKLLDENPDILAKYQDKFHYIMVDEYQDTNDLQYRLVRALSGHRKNICVVGDDDQCIYQWRGADIRNILEFERDFKNTKTIKLEQNYRSHSHILGAANSVIKNNLERKQKKLWTSAVEGEKPKYIIANDEKDEARKVVGELQALRENANYDYSDMAILYRTNVQSRALEMVLRSSSIPYKMVGALRYYDRKEIKDMLSYMRLVVMPTDDLAFLRVINEPKRGMGAKTLANLESQARKHNLSLWEALNTEEIFTEFSDNLQTKLASFKEPIIKHIEDRKFRSPLEIYEELLDETGYMAMLAAEDTDEADGRIANLLEFKTAISDYEQGEKEIDIQPTLAGFLESITLESDKEESNSADANAVSMMTMHSAKGLEYKVVFIVGMEEGLCPSTRSLDNGISGIEEERRLCYVAITRAMERLFILRARGRTLYGHWNGATESRFLKEIDKKHIDAYIPPGNDETGMFHRAYGSGDGRRPRSDNFKYVPPMPVRVDKAKRTAISYKNGDKVFHEKFGEGLVIESDVKTVSVMFATEGKKKLALGIAPLVKI